MRAVVVASAAMLALTGCAGGGKTVATAPAVTVTATPAAPRPATFTVGTPEYQQLLACLFNAGYTGTYQSADTSVPVIHETGKGLPEINFRVDPSAKPRAITPEQGRDTVLLHTAGCL